MGDAIRVKRVAIVTGAGGGIGRATAVRLSERGYGVALVGRTAKTLEAAAREIRASKGETMVITADVARSEDVNETVEQVVKKWSRVDVLVNNAGLVMSRSLAQMTDEEWRNTLDVNLSATFYATRAVWAVMKKQFETERKEGGVIVNISSMAAKDPFTGLGAYAVAKSGINILTLVAAREGEAAGIRVVAIAPGGVDTGMFSGLVGEKNVRRDEILQPTDVAAMVADVVGGSLRHCSGETIYLHKSVG